MNYFIKLSFILAVSICFYSCYFKGSRPPEFVDGGETINSLQRTYNFQSIEYENWEDDDATDSSLTICFINSILVPSGDVDESYKQLKGIVSQIRKSLKKPEKYKSYYVIFVKRDNHSGLIFNSHTTGADIPSEEL